MAELTLPPIGLGTARHLGDTCVEAVSAALELGYRHIDTAQMYGNEEAVGRGLAASDVPREAVTLATKVLPHNLAYDDVISSTRESLAALGVDAVDLLYVHWPARAYDPADTLAAFDALYDEGLARNVGVSNFTPSLLAEARDRLDAPVVAHQVEMHPLLPQSELVADAQAHDMQLVAYSPLGTGAILDDPVLQEVADDYDATVAQVALAWIVGHDTVVAIPKATGRDHLAENLAAAALELAPADRERIDAIERRTRTTDPEYAPWRGA